MKEGQSAGILVLESKIWILEDKGGVRLLEFTYAYAYSFGVNMAVAVKLACIRAY